MPLKSQFETLLAWHFHTIRTLMERAGTLSEAEYHENSGYSHGSIHDLLFHTLRTDRSWRVGLETGQQPPRLEVNEFPDLPALRQLCDSEQEEWNAWLGRRTEAELEGVYALTRRGGGSAQMVVWRIVQHVILHGMQHGTETAHLLTQKGRSPGDIDFIFYA